MLATQPSSVLQSINASFQAELEGFHNVLKSCGIEMGLHSKASLERLSTLDEKRFETLKTYFRFYLGLMGEFGEPTSEQFGLTGELDLLRVCERRLGIVFDKGAYDKITDEDVIEIYNEDIVQIYRNLGFFKLCGYSLMDLLTHEFHELYDRSIHVNHLIFELAQQIRNRPYDLSPLSMLHIPQHLMKETFSEAQYCSLIQFKQVYPIYTVSRKFYGYLVIQGVNRVSKEAQTISFL